MGEPIAARAGADGSFHAIVDGVGAVDAEPGAVVPDTEVTISRVIIDRAPQSVEDVEVEAVGEGLLIEVDREAVLAPVTVTFDAAAPGADGTLIALHLNDEGGWNLVPAELSQDDALVIHTDDFSVLTWATTTLLKPVGDFIADKVAGRSSPPECKDAPEWASVDGPASGSTHACVRAGEPLDDGTQIVELEIKSNRGTYQWIQLPSTLVREYVWVEGRSELAHALLDRVVGRDTSVLLGPGKRMTIGYRQPPSPTQLSYFTYVDNVSGLLTMTREFINWATDETVNEAGGWLAVFACFGVVDIDLTNFENPVELGRPDLITGLIPCALDLLESFSTDPNKAVEAAADLLGPQFNDQNLTDLSLDGYRVGNKAARLLLILRLGTYIAKEFTFIVDALAAGLGEDNATTITLTLDAVAPPPKPAPRVNLTDADGRAVPDWAATTALALMDALLASNWVTLDGLGGVEFEAAGGGRGKPSDVVPEEERSDFEASAISALQGPADCFEPASFRRYQSCRWVDPVTFFQMEVDDVDGWRSAGTFGG